MDKCLAVTQKLKNTGIFVASLAPVLDQKRNILELVILDVSKFWTLPGIPDVEETLEVSASRKNHAKNQLAAGDEARFVSFLVSLISILLGSFSYRSLAAASVVSEMEDQGNG